MPRKGTVFCCERKEMLDRKLQLELRVQAPVQKWYSFLASLCVIRRLNFIYITFWEVILFHYIYLILMTNKVFICFSNLPFHPNFPFRENVSIWWRFFLLWFFLSFRRNFSRIGKIFTKMENFHQTTKILTKYKADQ